MIYKNIFRYYIFVLNRLFSYIPIGSDNHRLRHSTPHTGVDYIPELPPHAIYTCMTQQTQQGAYMSHTTLYFHFVKDDYIGGHM